MLGEDHKGGLPAGEASKVRKEGEKERRKGGREEGFISVEGAGLLGLENGQDSESQVCLRGMLEKQGMRCSVAVSRER